MLKKGYGKKTIGQNIGTEMAAGKPHNQAVAIALDTARTAAVKAGKPEKAPKPRKTKSKSSSTRSKKRGSKKNSTKKSTGKKGKR